MDATDDTDHVPPSQDEHERGVDPYNGKAEVKRIVVEELLDLRVADYQI